MDLILRPGGGGGGELPGDRHDEARVRLGSESQHLIRSSLFQGDQQKGQKTNLMRK